MLVKPRQAGRELHRRAKAGIEEGLRATLRIVKGIRRLKVEVLLEVTQLSTGSFKGAMGISTDKPIMPAMFLHR